MREERRVRIVTGVLLAVVFVAGILVGVVVERALLRAGEGPWREAREGRGPRRSLVIERVGLSPEQKARVDSIVEVYRGEMSALWRETRSRLRVLAESTRADIKEVLTPEQRARYDSLLEARRREHRHRDRRGGRP